jgi:hypothetical protein
MTGILLATFPKAAFGGVSADKQNSDVSITITNFQVYEPIITPRVNNQRLELSWKIRNNTDHDVWVLVSQTPEYTYVYDVFMDSDAKTLVLRRRFNLPEGQGWEHLPRARHVRLRPDQEITESVSLPLPVKSDAVFDRLRGNAEFAKRLAVEIGYYDEDLPGLILQIVEMAEQLNCDIGLDSPIHDPYDMDVRRRFFGGVFVARVFYLESFEYFRNSVTSGGDEIFIPYMWQTLEGEQVLRATIDGVSIPYKSNYPPLNDESAQDETEPTDVTMALTGFDVNDTHLELSWNIKNNTDHDVWVCESMSRDYPPPLFEQFLDEDAKTLVIRKLFNLPMRWYEYPPIGGRYVRLHPGEEKVESYSVALPVRPYRMTVANKVTNAEYAERLALEIGYYDEDLPSLILEIVEISEHLNIDFSVGYYGFRKDVRDRFFGGPIVALLFKGMLAFEPSVRSADADGEMWMPDLDVIRMGEQVLRIEVDGVSIPYKSNYPPLNN